MRGHWSRYAVGAGWPYRFRVCLVCGKVWRNADEKALIHKGGKP